MRKIGLDVGDKTVGIAVSDPLGITAQGLMTLERVGIRKDTGKILDLVKEYECDTLLLSCGLLPENELSRKAEVKLDAITGGAQVDQNLMSSVEGIFAAGNVLHIHDLVDYVSNEAALAGYKASQYLKKGIKQSEKVKVKVKNGVRYCVPQYVDKNPDEDVRFRFRTDNIYRDKYLTLKVNDKTLSHIRKKIMAPGEMEQLVLKKMNEEIQNIEISLEDE